MTIAQVLLVHFIHVLKRALGVLFAFEEELQGMARAAQFSPNPKLPEWVSASYSLPMARHCSMTCWSRRRASSSLP